MKTNPNSTPVTKSTCFRLRRWLCLALLTCLCFAQSASAAPLVNLKWTYTRQSDGRLHIQLEFRLVGAPANSNFVYVSPDGKSFSFRVGPDGEGLFSVKKGLADADSDWATQHVVSGAGRFYNRADRIPFEIPYSITVTNPLKGMIGGDDAARRFMKDVLPNISGTWFNDDNSTEPAIINQRADGFLWGTSVYGGASHRWTGRFTSPNTVELRYDENPTALYIGTLAANGLKIGWNNSHNWYKH
ncbi:MAG: hypothetical protein ABIP20_09310 [Chthoniobacteraceae bacterium]